MHKHTGTVSFVRKVNVQCQNIESIGAGASVCFYLIIQKPDLTKQENNRSEKQICS